MLLSDYFNSGLIVRNGEFFQTMPIHSEEKNSICYVANKKFVSEVNNNSNISCVIASEEIGNFVRQEKGLLVCSNPSEEYYQLHNFLVEKELMVPLVIEPYIASSAKIHPTACVAARVYIGENVQVGPFAVIEEDSVIGHGSYIGHNVVIGCRGMQNVRLKDKSLGIKFFGGVRIGENCEVLTNAIIQKPYQKFFTEVGNNTQISVKVSVGHGAKIGNHTQIAGNVTIAGNVRIGDGVWIGPSATIADGVSVGSNARVLLGSVVSQAVPSGVAVSGNFAQRHEQQLKNFALIRRL